MSTTLTQSRQLLLFLLMCSIMPVTSFMAFNKNEIDLDLSRGFIYLLLNFSILSFLFLFFKTFIKNTLKLALCLGFSYVFLFHTSILHNLFRDFIGDAYRFRYFAVFLPALLLALLGALSFFSSKKPKEIYQFLTIMMCSFIVIQVLELAPSLKSDTLIKYNSNYIPNQKNVYYILPDMMMGIESYLKFFNEEHLLANNLEKKGFVLNKNAYTNAPFTIYSLAHLYNMDYLLSPDEVVTPTKINHLNQLARGNNPTFKKFHSMGYRIVHAVDGYSISCSQHADTCIEAKSFWTKQDVSYFDRTQLISFLDNLQFLSNAYNLISLHYPQGIDPEALLSLLPIQENNSTFTMVHLGLPHMPFRYKADCSTYSGDLEYYSGDKMKVYHEQHLCAEKKIDYFVSEIQRKDPDALILVQSDHGPLTHEQGFKKNSDLTALDLLENFNIISAYKVPKSCENLISREGISPVNSFKIIFSCLDGSALELLTDKSFVVYPLNNPSGMEPTLVRHFSDEPNLVSSIE